MMKSATKDKIYKSPVRKLTRFFEKSRDQWKAKCREAKRTIKYFKNRVRFLEESRDRWRSQAQELEARVKQMEAKEREWQGKQEVLELRGSEKNNYSKSRVQNLGSVQTEQMSYGSALDTFC